MDTQIAQILKDSSALKAQLATDEVFNETVSRSCAALFDCISKGGTIYACGNGGSTCDAMHLVEEFVARYKRERRGIRAQHFMDPSVLTCWSNDYSYENAFRRYAETFCTDKDVLVAISTSGGSKNVLQAVRAAKEGGAVVIGLAGKDGGELGRLSDVGVVVPSQLTERIQEVHITVIHIWLEVLETRYGLASS